MKRIILSGFFGIGMLLASTPVPMLAFPAQEFGRPYNRMREIIDRTQSDVRYASQMAANGRQRDRCEDAQRSLSDFDRHLARGRFERGEMERSIGRVRSILDHNTLQARLRDALARDLEDLRIARDRFER